METNKKKMYVSPESETLELRLEGVVAASGDPADYVNPYDEELTF